MDSPGRRRRRVTGALYAGNALASTALLAAISVSVLAAEKLMVQARRLR